MGVSLSARPQDYANDTSPIHLPGVEKPTSSSGPGGDLKHHVVEILGAMDPGLVEAENSTGKLRAGLGALKVPFSVVVIKLISRRVVR